MVTGNASVRQPVSDSLNAALALSLDRSAHRLSISPSRPAGFPLSRLKGDGLPKKKNPTPREVGSGSWPCGHPTGLPVGKLNFCSSCFSSERPHGCAPRPAFASTK